MRDLVMKACEKYCASNPNASSQSISVFRKRNGIWMDFQSYAVLSSPTAPTVHPRFLCPIFNATVVSCRINGEDNDVVEYGKRVTDTDEILAEISRLFDEYLTEVFKLVAYVAGTDVWSKASSATTN